MNVEKTARLYVLANQESWTQDEIVEMENGIAQLVVRIHELVTNGSRTKDEEKEIISPNPLGALLDAREKYRGQK